MTAPPAKLIYLHTDHLATPRSASNDDGTIIWSWDGDAFGHNADGGGINTDPDGDGKTTNIRLRFAGQYYDRESGLYYNHNRDYDPRLGRYIQSDPIGLWDGVNRYNYVKANPLNAVDPDGLSARPSPCPPGTPSGVGCGTKTPSPGYTPGREEPTGPGSACGEFDCPTAGPPDGGGGGGSLPPVDEEEEEESGCQFSSSEAEMQAFGEYIESLNVFRRSPTADFRTVRIADRLGDLPRFAARPIFVTHYQRAISMLGLHLINVRIPFTGLHIATESGSNGIFAHHDFFDPTISVDNLRNHNEIEVAGLRNGTIDNARITTLPTWQEACGAIN